MVALILYLNQANAICKITTSDDLTAKKMLAQEIFGSNLLLADQKVQINTAKTAVEPLKAHWKALKLAQLEAGKIEKSCVLARLYAAARTHFKADL